MFLESRSQTGVWSREHTGENTGEKLSKLNKSKNLHNFTFDLNNTLPLKIKEFFYFADSRVN